MSVLAQLKSKPTLKAGTTFLVKGGKDAKGKLVWFFVCVESAKVKAFQKEFNNGMVPLSQYGTVLASGFGEIPPASVVERMKKVYGYKEQVA